MTASIAAALLVASALALTLAAPRLLTLWTTLRRSPAEGLLLWQSASLSGVLCALLAAPVAVLADPSRHPRLTGLAVVVTVAMVARLLWSAHSVGSDLRRMRAQHRELVDLVGERVEHPAGREPLTVIAHASPTAYCLPGSRDRIVLTSSAVDRLCPDELAAVLAHEQAHLGLRHDLVLELFTVLHEAVPQAVRAPGAIREVHLLIEALADRAATKEVGATTLARALVTMATRPAREVPPGHPEREEIGEEPHLAEDRVTVPTTTHSGSPVLGAVGGVGGPIGGDQIRTRLVLLAEGPAPAGFRALVTTLALAALALPAGFLLPLT